MIISELIKEKYARFISLCRAHRVKKLYAFGSAASGGFDLVRSDIDLLVEIEERDPIEKGDLLLRFFTAIEKFFNRKVDLLTDQPIENPYLKASIEKSKVLIYDGESEKILV